ncbi:MAG: patatin family protein, partial [Mariprofundus sp.]|nr:patatin family protein [Mariprofundus sp.]
MMYKNALIVEGGAMRSVFSAGLLDGFMQKQFNPFDLCLGASAGASNLVMFLTGKQQRGLHFFLDVARHREFISFARFLRGGHLMDMQWLFDMIARAELDLALLENQPVPLLICATDVCSGKPVYIPAKAKTVMAALKVSMSLPLIYREFALFQGREMTDGGMADAIPVHEAIRRGAKNIMLVRSRPASYIKKDSPGHRYIRWKLKAYPALVSAMEGRVQRHQAIIRLIQTPP